jgi:hypothetical protein
MPPFFRFRAEFVGEQHYFNMDVAFGPNGTSSFYSDRDALKQTFFKSRDITLICIPFWYVELD